PGPLVAARAPGKACTGDGGLVVCTDDASWGDAASRCAAAGMRLAVVRDDATQDAIERLLRAAGAPGTDPPGIRLPHQGAGLGWIDGTAATFVYFTAGEPNGGASDACIHMNWPRGAGSWNDAACDATEPWTGYVCQAQ